MIARRINPRRIVTAAVVLATVGAGTALTITANAGTSREPGRTAATDDTPRISAAMRAALRRDLNLTDAQLDARLRREAWAADTVRALRTTLGTAYAGAWLTNGGQRLNVAVSDRTLADEVRAAGAEAKVVARGAGKLTTVKQALDRRASAAPSTVTGWYVDPATNTVVVRATRVSAARAFVRAARVDTTAVRMVAVKEAPELLSKPHKPAPSPSESEEAPPPPEETEPPATEPPATEPPATDEPADPNAREIRGGAPYIIEQQARCSVGFAVRGGFVSAGHCGDEGDATAAQEGQELVAQGEFQASQFPESDFSFVAVNENFTPVGEVNDFGGEGQGAADLGQPLPVAGSEEAVVGTAVCKFGSTTGASCGEIQALDVTVNFADPADGIGTVEVNGLIGTDVCAEPGDSGGSLLAGDQAQGVVSGGSGDCDQGGETFFQPVNEILETLNLTLLTS